MLNQRRAERAPLDVYLNKYVAGVPYLARACDISREGVRVLRLLEPDQRAERVGLQFQLPGSDEVIYAEGEVLRDARPDSSAGIRFTLLTDRHRRMIDRYIAKTAPLARAG